MKILVITPYFFPHLGGSERYIEQLYSSVMQLDKSIQVDILTYNTNHSQKRERYKGMTIYRVGCIELLLGQFALPNYIELIWLLRRLKQGGGYQVVNTHTRFFENSWWAWLVAQYFGAVSLLTDHCADHPIHSNLIVRKMAELIDHLVIPFMGKKYDLITVVAHATKTFLRQHGIKKTVSVIPNSIDVASIVKRSTNKKITISFVGRPIQAKGIDIFSAVANILKKEFPLCQFVKVTNKTHEQVMKALEETDILIHPSIHHEGLPTVILEAGIMGCAVVATNRGGTSEIIIDGETGLLVEPTIEAVTKATRKLIKDAGLRTSVSKRLRDKVITEFSWKQTASNYIAFIKGSLSV